MVGSCRDPDGDAMRPSRARQNPTVKGTG